MAKPALTEYERRRLENIRRNEEMISSIKRKADDLSASMKESKRKPYRPPKPHQPAVVIRRSLRTRGLSPDSSSHVRSDLPPPPAPIVSPAKKKGPILIEEAFIGTLPVERHFAEMINDMTENAPLRIERAEDSWDPANVLRLESKNVRRLLPGRILSVCFFPFGDRRVLAAGDKYGHLGFWDADFGNGEGNGSYVFAPHSSPVSGILIHPFSPSKVRFQFSY